MTKALPFLFDPEEALDRVIAALPDDFEDQGEIGALRDGLAQIRQQQPVAYRFRPVGGPHWVLGFKDAAPAMDDERYEVEALAVIPFASGDVTEEPKKPNQVAGTCPEDRPLAKDEIGIVTRVSRDGGDLIVRCPHCKNLRGIEGHDMKDVRGESYICGCGGEYEVAYEARLVDELPEQGS